ncbi:unnamed protein product [Blepharisma stoltei]|uniref:Nuclear speckle splicing regulatory protein 1 N-terminal domain-containing protein n=1 Tax=Blepharisma stoltei TaxID=1481888 RepID=A0AAU9IC74_9CILI|nr:unnamed protein product [Blepharisma stoltei]
MNGKFEMNLGKSQKKYGLIKTKNVFKVEENDEEDAIKAANLDIVKESLMRQQKSDEALYRALAEDPTIISYDKFYESFKDKPEQKDVEKKPKYLDAIKAANEFRKKEKNLIKERVEAKKREKEAKELGETETFITPSYIKFLQENNQWAADLEKKDERSEMHSVSNSNGDIRNFYANLLTKNSAMGNKSEPEPRKIQKIEEVEKSSSESEEVEMPEEPPKAAEEDTENNINQESTPEPLPEKKGEKDIQSARERFLLRKAQSNNSSNMLK